MLHKESHAERVPNALIDELSPYLLQHAYNPVNWRPWSPATLEVAQQENKPIFLSIGYATCHWCHVMEHESFEDAEVATILNESFIAIKVDREERPDIDAVYMELCQAMTGHGGWPLSVFLCPNLEPFYVGTYFPKTSRQNRIGFIELLSRIRQTWTEEPDRITRSAGEVVRALQERASSDYSGELNNSIFEKSFDYFDRTFDEANGGFQRRPKFPSPHNLIYLLRYSRLFRSPRALNMASQTLRAMRNGGIFDQIGFGFHRYSTDEKWLLPHFEKMLYDQAMLLLAYAEGYAATQEALFAQTCHDIVDYLRTDLHKGRIGFCSAEDADSEGEEGKFYTWSTDELSDLLQEDAPVFIDYYSCTREGNFFDEASGHRNGTNILHRLVPVEVIAQRHALSTEELRAKILACNDLLRQHRSTRIRPLLDDKILTDWNGLMIGALAYSARILDCQSHFELASQVFDAMVENMSSPTTLLLHRHRDGNSAISGMLDDYAFMAFAGMELYQYSGQSRFLERTCDYLDFLLSDFRSDDGAMYLVAGGKGETGIDGGRQAYDGAIPSGNSMAAYCLARIGVMVNRQEYINASMLVAQSFAQQINSHPSGFSWMLNSLLFLTKDRLEIAVRFGEDAQLTSELVRTAHSTWCPNAVLVYPDLFSDRLAESADYPKSSAKVPQVFVCRNYSCGLPISEPKALRQTLSE